jgi:transcriptional regulator with XRE-family HTH domain
MPRDRHNPSGRLTGHALRNAHLRARSLERARTAPPLAHTLVTIRAKLLGMTRLEFARRSGIGRGTLRDLELGIHTPTRRTLQQFVAFCEECAVGAEHLEELRRLYAGAGVNLTQFIARLELQAGSARELARRVGISPATLWEYRRGNFPLPPALLRRLCEAVGADPAPAHALWHEAERRRFLERGYPPALAEFWVLCGREGYAEKHLPRLGMSMAAVRRLRYLELPPWPEVAGAARAVCRDDEEWGALRNLWVRDEEAQRGRPADRFGARLEQLRKRQGVGRRDLADLFGIGGKKPARIIKAVEEDGLYSAQAYPAGLVALLAEDAAEQDRLLGLWQERRRQFHRRHRPETRTDLRLAREWYGFEPRDMEPLLGYSSLEYQRLERGVGPLLPSAQDRILQAMHRAGWQRVEALLRRRVVRAAEKAAWQLPPSVPALIALLAKREGGLVPLARHLRRAGLKGFSAVRLRAVARGQEVPPWAELEGVARACDVADLADARHDWTRRYRAWLQTQCASPLAVEVRLLIAEVAPSLRAFGARLTFNYSVLVRDLQRLGRDAPTRWSHVERILRAAGLPANGGRWREIQALWYTAGGHERNATAPPPRRPSSAAAL